MEIKCPGIKRLQLTAIWRWLRHRTAKIFTYRLGSLIKAFGIDEMEPFGRFACAERKLREFASGHSMPLRRNDDVCDLRLA